MCKFIFLELILILLLIQLIFTFYFISKKIKEIFIKKIKFRIFLI